MRLHFHRRWLVLGGLWIGLVIFLSLTPAPPKPLTLDHSDKLAHLLAYGWLMLWFCQLYVGAARRWALAIGLIALGVGLEFLQTLTPTRSYDVLDMLANSTGVLLGALLAATPLAHALRRVENYCLRQA